MKVQIAINGPDFLHEISGKADDGTEIVLTIPTDWSNKVSLCNFIIPEGMGLVSYNIAGSFIHKDVRLFREGIDTNLSVDVFLPYPWSSRKLVSKQPVCYVSRRGWVDGLFFWLKNKIKEAAK